MMSGWGWGLCTGSSPRGRGKPRPAALRAGPVGLIPAWAGKTSRRTTSTAPVRAHPRVGGENIRNRHRNNRVAGLIPAWAGKTRELRSYQPFRWAHPRVGGENSEPVCVVIHARGSSPRGRGKQHQGSQRPDLHRLIPAWAGKTWPPPSQSGTRRAHPRVGGENHGLGVVPVIPSGSSPRGRGKLMRRRTCRSSTGLIPAWAGKTPHPAAPPYQARAHPRVGGENQVRASRDGRLSGSSPRGRGKRIRHPDQRPRLGLIPAWAGKTGDGAPEKSGARAHPRVGGENDDDHTHLPLVTGSSPRGRGKPRYARA